MFWQKSPDKQYIINTLERFIQKERMSGLVIQDGHVLVTLEIDPSQHGEMENLRKEAEAALLEIKHVKQARIILTAEKAPQQEGKPEVRAVAPLVKDIIAVASGKGGVGKSTVAVNLAVALSQQGLRVGLLDADVYGPSVPMLTGLRSSKPEQLDDYIIPLEAHGIKVMSMGFMVDEEAPMVWRGPMVQSAILQMLRDVRWGELDILVIDMPPGTGDTQLTIAQKVKLSGAVIVSTPQDIALLDTVKGVHMFEKVAVPILGIIENMSYFHCAHCGKDSDVFGTHGARKRAEELKVEFLGDIPLDIGLREASDQGRPIVLQEKHKISEIFKEISLDIKNKLQGRSGLKPAPKIVIGRTS